MHTLRSFATLERQKRKSKIVEPEDSEEGHSTALALMEFHYVAHTLGPVQNQKSELNHPEQRNQILKVSAPGNYCRRCNF